MPSPHSQYTIQNWNDSDEVGPTPIWADQSDAGAGPSLEHVETGIYNAHEDALSALTTANAAIPKPASPSSNDVVYWNGSAYASGKVTNSMITDNTIASTKLAPGTANQILRTNAAGTAVAWSSDFIPLRTIVGFHMDTGAESIPSGWYACNGQTVLAANHDLGGGNYTTPDLRNRFLLGADPATAVANAGTTSDTSGGAPGPKGVGGSQTHTITTSEMPSHTHTGSSDSQGSHTHTATTDSQGSHNHGGATGSTAPSTSSESNDHYHDYRHVVPGTITVGLSGGTGYLISSYDDSYQTSGITANHTHTVNTHAHTISSDGGHTHTITVGSAGSHTHTITIGSTGSGTAFDHRPRFYGMVYIMKLKHI